MKMKVFWLYTRQCPYPIRFFNLLGESVDLTVAFHHVQKKEHTHFYGDHIKTFHTVSLKPYYLGGSHQILSLLGQKTFDRVILDGNRSLLERRAASFVTNQGSSFSYFFSYQDKVDQKYLASASHCFVPDLSWKQKLSLEGVSNQTIHLYHDAILLSSETISRPLNEKERLLLRQGLGLHEKKIYISINTLSMVKQNLALLDLWKSMPQETLLLLFVDGTNKHFYQERIQKRHLTNVKLLLGEKRDDVLKYLRIADAALWTDEEDSYPYQVTTALSQGVPVFGNKKSPVTKKLIQEGINGYPLDFHHDFASLFVKPLPPAMAQAAIESAKSFTLENMLQECKNVLLLP